MISNTSQSRYLRAIVLIAIGLIAVWQLITVSLAAYLAFEAPEAALQLNSKQPTAIVALADKRSNVAPGGGGTEVTGVTRQVANEESESTPQATDRLDGWAEIALKAAAKWLAQDATIHSERHSSGTKFIPDWLTEAEKDNVRAQVELAVIEDPLNARALRILGQLADSADDEDLAAKFMQAAARRSLRERLAIYWLMQNSLEKENATAALHYADALMRARPQLIRFAMPILVQLAENQELDAKDALIAALASDPPWRAEFLSSLHKYVSIASTPLDLLLSLKNTATPPTAVDLEGYLSRLIRERYYELAYYTWLQFLPPEQLSSIGLLFNGSFEAAPSGLPFDWVIAAKSGVVVETSLRPDKSNEHALLLEFGKGRANFRGVSQLLMLPPGSYQFKGAYTGELKGPRGLQWRISCSGKKGGPIGEGDMFVGSEPTWQEFELTFTVPDAECRAQDLRLSLAARSVSEQLVTGAVWYDDLRISRIVQPNQIQKAEESIPRTPSIP